MASKKQEGRGKPVTGEDPGLEGIENNLLAAFSSDLRLRLLAELIKEGEAAPSDLARRLRCSVFNADYHIKKLVEYGFAEFVRAEEIGSLSKKYYRATRKIEFPKEVFDRLDPAIKPLVLATVFKTSYSDVEIALEAGSFVSRPESHASWTRVKTDKRAWQEIIDLLDATLHQAIDLARKGGDRLDAAEDQDESGMLISLNLSAFTLPQDSSELTDHGTDTLQHQAEEIEDPPNL